MLSLKLQYKKACDLAIYYHAGQTDKGGNSYLKHVFAVSEGGETLEEKIVGVLHDIDEDTECTLEKLIEEGIADYLVEAVGVLSKSKGEIYLEYLKKVKKNKIARKVKIRDLKHNMDPSRLECITDKDLKRMEKYQKALVFLESE